MGFDSITDYHSNSNKCPYYFILWQYYILYYFIEILLFFFYPRRKRFCGSTTEINYYYYYTTFFSLSFNKPWIKSQIKQWSDLKEQKKNAIFEEKWQKLQ